MNKIYCNQPERDTRSATWLVFFDKKKLTFNNNLKGKLPNPLDYLFKVRINTTSDFSRRVKHSYKDLNPFYKIQIKNSFYPIKNRQIEELINFEKRNAYSVFLVTNDDVQVYGNDREPMSFRIQDAIEDNGSGSDHFELIVEGNTTLKLQTGQIVEPVKSELFRVLLYTPPME